MSGIVIYILQRISYASEGTFGALFDPLGNQLCFTAELPWCDNEPDKSCIPSGIYNVIAYNSPTKGQVWQIQDVPNRSNIEIHAANLPSQLKGCIAVGMKLGFLETHQAVLQSDTALIMLRKELPSSFILSIIDVNSPS